MEEVGSEVKGVGEMEEVGSEVKVPQYPTRCVVRGLTRQHDAALTNFVGCFFLLCLISFFSLGAE